MSSLPGTFMFFSASLEADGLPFAVRHRQPNPETLAALKEAEDIIAGHVSAIRYDSVSAALDAALEEE